MAIAITLKEYFDNNHTQYNFITHRTTKTALDSSRTAHLPAEKVSKAVMLESKHGDYLMACVPANSRLSLSQVQQITGKSYELMAEDNLNELFPDCANGAIPALGKPYQIDMLIDDSLLASDDVYIESGDHRHLIAFKHHDYANLVEQARHGNIRGNNVGAPRIWERTNLDWSI